MARYTDIDLLIDKVYETTWYHINKNGELVTGANSETDIPLYKHADIERVLSEAPEADVVPKSEVLEMQKEQLGKLKEIKSEVECVTVEYEAMRAAANSYKMHYEQAKAEVAREIFAEIEKTIRAALILIGFSYKHQAKEMECRKECYEDFLGYIDELKKKYIKSCRTCKHMLSCEPNVFGICDEYEEG